MDCRTIIQLSLQDLKAVIFEAIESEKAKALAEAKEKERIHRGQFYTRKEVSKILGVTYPTLHRWDKMRLLVPVKCGRNVRYRDEDIKAFTSKRGGVK